MSQLSFSSFDSSLMVRDAQGRYLLATAEQILEAARQSIERKMQRGTSFTSPAAVKEYLRAKLAGYEHEVFAVLFMDTQHRLIEYAEMRISAMVINRFGERDQSGRWCCAVNG
ncbi:JAB domain-containing protein, partial [Burkholderia vietnamiensis]|uniref:JAB domain-containing protein n=1 Tax=Burkholderia vietnamiensis TaxID=60552 RepID=UPI000A98550F